MNGSREGGCQCGAVRYRISGKPIALAVCHCMDCQRQSGSAFGMTMLMRKDSFEILSGELRSFTKVAESGNSLSCLFCPNCGNRIYHEDADASGNIVRLKPGTLDDTSWLEPDIHVWTKRKHPWVAIPEGVPSEAEQP